MVLLLYSSFISGLGWPPSRSRSMKTYFSTKRGGNLLPLGKRCRKHRTKHRTDYSKTRLLIAVKSGVDSFEQRNATRSTFGSLTHKKYSDVAVIHFIARTLDAELQAKGIFFFSLSEEAGRKETQPSLQLFFNSGQHIFLNLKHKQLIRILNWQHFTHPGI